MSYPRRMWINQPSTHQPHHALHGRRVLAMRERGTLDGATIERVYFLSGDVVDQQMVSTALSEGWPRGSFVGIGAGLRTLRALLDDVTVRWHKAQRGVIYDRSGNLSRDLRALRADVDGVRSQAGLPPSPLTPVWSDEEKDDA